MVIIAVNGVTLLISGNKLSNKLVDEMQATSFKINGKKIETNSNVVL